MDWRWKFYKKLLPRIVNESFLTDDKIYAESFEE